MPSYSGIFTLQAQMQAKAASNWTGLPLVIGQAYAGGFYAGQIGVSGVATHNLVIAPRSSGQSSLTWKNVRTDTTGASSDIDGPQNTADMVADGSSTVYPCAHFCNDLVIGGFSDWYMPAKHENMVCYVNLKPTTTSNNTSSGTNTNAVPERTSNYTSGNPAQTAATNFKSGGTEAFSLANYWSSTEFNSERAKNQNFDFGYTYYGNFKNDTKYVRAVRRVAV
jgi:hypothetical protein